MENNLKNCTSNLGLYQVFSIKAKEHGGVENYLKSIVDKALSEQKNKYMEILNEETSKAFKEGQKYQKNKCVSLGKGLVAGLIIAGAIEFIYPKIKAKKENIKKDVKIDIESVQSIVCDGKEINKNNNIDN